MKTPVSCWAVNDALPSMLRGAGYEVVQPGAVGAGCVVDDVAVDDAAEAGRRLAGTPFIVATASQQRARIDAWADAGARDVFQVPISRCELIVRVEAMLRRKHNVVCIGGGTGLFHLLRGLRSVKDLHLTSIVSVFDDGGSSGRLRTEFGVLPPGDVRRSLVALSDAPELMNEVIQYRFDAGEGLKGHTIGNLILTALCDLGGGMPEAVRAMGDILHIRGIVLCTSATSARLCAELEDGTIIRGESKIDLCDGRAPDLRIRRLFHEPTPSCTIETYAAIRTADTIVIGPGDLYTSIAANLSVEGLGEAIAQSAARCVYVCNVMTKPGETFGYDTADHVREVVRYLGGDRLDHVVTSTTPVGAEVEAAYAAKGQVAVRGELANASDAELISADIADAGALVRHDSAKLADVLSRLFAVR